MHRQEEIEKLRDRATHIRKNRQQVRGQKLAADSAAAKQRFEEELEKLDSELEETECKLTKLQLLVQEKDTSRSGIGNLKKKNSHSTSSATRTTRVVTTSSAGRRLNGRPPQKKQQAVSVINKCITSKVGGITSPTRNTSASPRHKTDPSLSTQVARSDCLAVQRGTATGNGLTKTQSGAKTSTVQQKLKLWESISDSSSTC